MTVFGQMVRFGGVGLCGTAVHYAVLAFLMEVGGTSAVTGTMAGYAAGTVVNYGLNARFTFAGKRGHGTAMLRYGIVAGLGFVQNAVIVWLLDDAAGWHYGPAQLIATGVVFGTNFVLARQWVFAARVTP